MTVTTFVDGDPEVPRGYSEPSPGIVDRFFSVAGQPAKPVQPQSPLPHHDGSVLDKKTLSEGLQFSSPGGRRGAPNTLISVCLDDHKHENTQF